MLVNVAGLAEAQDILDAPKFAVPAADTQVVNIFYICQLTALGGIKMNILS